MGGVLLFMLSVFFIADYFGWPLPILRQFDADTVVIRNESNFEMGLLVDGTFQQSAQTTPVFKNDAGFVSKSTPIPVGHVTKAAAAAQTNEVVVFSGDRPMFVRQNVPWTPSYDDIEVKLNAKRLALPITVWVMYDKDTDDKIDKEKKDVLSAVAQTNATWKSEKTGLLLVAKAADFKNALPAKNPKSTGYAKFDCETNPTGKIAALKSDIGHDKGRINLYVVDEVKVAGKFAKFHGQVCVVGSDITVIGSKFQSTLLTHEMGHNLGLYHPPPTWMKSSDRTKEDTKKNKFSVYNVMVPDALSHKYLTEGQVFRAHVHSGSALNDVYTERAAFGSSNGYPVRSKCSYTFTDNTCPRLDRRLWSNGSSYPSN